jgi:hypothetical protein
MLLYVLNVERIRDEEGSVCRMYGVSGYAVDLRGIHRAAIIRSLSADFGAVLRLAVDCTCGQLAPIHLYDVAEDRFFL